MPRERSMFPRETDISAKFTVFPLTIADGSNDGCCNARVTCLIIIIGMSHAAEDRIESGIPRLAFAPSVNKVGSRLRNSMNVDDAQLLHGNN